MEDLISGYVYSHQVYLYLCIVLSVVLSCTDEHLRSCTDCVSLLLLLFAFLSLSLPPSFPLSVSHTVALSYKLQQWKLSLPFPRSPHTPPTSLSVEVRPPLLLPGPFEPETPMPGSVRTEFIIHLVLAHSLCNICVFYLMCFNR